MTAGLALLAAEEVKFDISFQSRSGSAAGLDDDLTKDIHFTDGRVDVWATFSPGTLSGVERLGRPFGSSFPLYEKEAPQRASIEVNEMANQMKTENDDSASARDNGRQANPPVGKLTAGGVRLAVWANDGPKGGTYYTVSLERTFRRKDGDWDSSTSLRINDIPKAIAILQKAYDRLVVSVDDCDVESHQTGASSPISSSPADDPVRENIGSQASPLW